MTVSVDHIHVDVHAPKRGLFRGYFNRNDMLTAKRLEAILTAIFCIGNGKLQSRRIRGISLLMKVLEIAAKTVETLRF